MRRRTRPQRGNPDSVWSVHFCISGYSRPVPFLSGPAFQRDQAALELFGWSRSRDITSLGGREVRVLRSKLQLRRHRAPIAHATSRRQRAQAAGLARPGRLLGCSARTRPWLWPSGKGSDLRRPCPLKRLRITRPQPPPLRWINWRARGGAGVGGHLWGRSGPNQVACGGRDLDRDSRAAASTQPTLSACSLCPHVCRPDLTGV